MTTKEIKSLLHDSIESIENESFLEAIQMIIDAKYKNHPELNISDKHKEVLQVRERHIENGEFYTNEEVKKILNAWLKNRRNNMV